MKMYVVLRKKENISSVKNIPFQRMYKPDFIYVLIMFPCINTSAPC